MIYFLGVILVGFGAWYGSHIYQKVMHARNVRRGLYTPPSPEQLRTLDKAIESAKVNPPVYRGSFAKYADDDK
jgi:hypothetical protein